MAKFLFSGSYTSDGTKGLLKEGGSSRRAMLDEMIGSLGGAAIQLKFCTDKRISSALALSGWPWFE
jgi:hypothetical protein